MARAFQPLPCLGPPALPPPQALPPPTHESFSHPSAQGGWQGAHALALGIWLDLLLPPDFTASPVRPGVLVDPGSRCGPEYPPFPIFPCEPSRYWGGVSLGSEVAQFLFRDPSLTTLDRPFSCCPFS